MSNALKDYFAKGKKVEVHPESARVYEERMKVVLPEIVADTRSNEKLIAELRSAPFARQSTKKRAITRSDV